MNNKKTKFSILRFKFNGIVTLNKYYNDRVSTL
jgi:hypothetical protein